MMTSITLPKTKMRGNSGENHYKAKLTWEDIELIKELRSKYNLSYQKIADKFDVTHTTIRSVIIGKSWQ